MGKFEKSIINEIKSIGLDLNYNKPDGNPESLLTTAEVFYSLYAEELSYKRNAPSWINRDRLIVSDSCSELLYATLFMSGFDISLNDLKEYYEINSNLGRFPRKDNPVGVDATTGVDTNSVSLAVGIALSERYFESLIEKIKPRSKLINYHTFCIVSNRDLLNGDTMEALSFAGTQNLNKLIVIYNRYKNVNDTDLEMVLDEEIESKFDAMNFDVVTVKNNGNPDRICEAIEDAKKAKRPSLIIVDSKLDIEDDLESICKKTTGNIKKEEFIQIKQYLEKPVELFNINESLKEKYIRNIDERCNSVYQKWLLEYENCRALNNNTLNRIIDVLESKIVPIDFDNTNLKINDGYFEELSISNEKILNLINNKSIFFLGGSLDCSKKNHTLLKNFDYMSIDNPLGKNIPFGYRKNAMAGIINGLSISNLKVFSSMNANEVYGAIKDIKYSALNELDVCYILSTDNEKDVTEYYPNIEIDMLRLIPNLTVLKPCDINEVIGSWEYIVKNKETTALFISNTKMQKYRNTNANYVKYGAYMIRKERMRLDGIIIATGEDVALAMDISEVLYREGIDLRIVSMPSVELFLKQNPKYEEQLLPKNITTFVIETSNSLIWNRFATNKNCIFGLDRYAKTANISELKQENGIDKESIIRKIKENL